MSESTEPPVPQEGEVHLTFKLLPPRQTTSPEPILYYCPLCGNNIQSWKTQEHARDVHEVTSYELDNIGDHISIHPAEHTPSFIPPLEEVTGAPTQGDVGELEEIPSDNS